MAVKKLTGIFAALLALPACGYYDDQENPFRPHSAPIESAIPVVIDPLLDDAVNDFLDDCERFGRGSERYQGLFRLKYIRVEEVGENNLGLCWRGDQPWRVAIKPGLDAEWTKRVVYHELGHCILNQEHGDNVMMETSTSSDLISEEMLAEFFQ